MVMTQQLKEEWAARLRAPANLPFEAPAGYMDALKQVDTRTLKIPTSVGENTSYLITPKGRSLSDSAELLLEDMRRHVSAVDGITLF